MDSLNGRLSGGGVGKKGTGAIGKAPFGLGAGHGKGGKRARNEGRSFPLPTREAPWGASKVEMSRGGWCQVGGEQKNRTRGGAQRRNRGERRKGFGAASL